MSESLPPPGIFKTLPDGTRITSRPKSGGMGELEKVTLPPAGQLGDRAVFWGEAHITNGPGKCEVPGCGCDQMHKVSRNKITGQGLAHIMNRMLSVTRNGTTGGAGALAGTYDTNNPTRSYIRVGTGSGATTNGTTALVTPVATNPSSTSFAFSNPSTGVYRHSFTAVWNAGSITAETVTEIGVFGNLSVTFGTATNGTNLATNNPNHTALALFARLSVTDSEFSSFVINIAAPLIIEYRLTITF